MNESGIAAEVTETPNTKDFFYPPGGILLWIIILLELFTFGIAIIIFMYSAGQESAVFETSARQLNITIGSINTVVLLTSGYCMAKCVHLFRRGEVTRSRKQLLATLILGLVFMVLKAVEYEHKAAEGLTLGTNTFFDFYWMLTGFHLIHVATGMVILLWWNLTMQRKPQGEALGNLEAGAAFWHLCDLIWLLLFPVLYLIF